MNRSIGDALDPHGPDRKGDGHVQEDPHRHRGCRGPLGRRHGPGGPGGANFGYKGDGFYLNFGFGNDKRWDKPRVHKVCGPTYKTVKVWQKHRGWVWKTVYAGQECKFVPYGKGDKKGWDKHGW
jgi:hypothetical protein